MVGNGKLFLTLNEALNIQEFVKQISQLLL